MGDDRSKAMRLLNVKAPDWLHDLVEKATQASGARDKSHWVRDALEAGARREIAEASRRPSGTSLDDPGAGPTPPLGRRPVGHGRVLGRVATPTGCTHPPTARFVGVESETCTLCGAVVRRRL